MIINYLNYEGLQTYDSLIKKYINSNILDQNTIATTIMEAVQEYVDLQIENSIVGIETAKIYSLFKESIPVGDINADLDEYIDNIGENQILVLVNNGDYEEELSIANDVYINANGSTMSGGIVVEGNVNVTIENAIITKAMKF
jgi:hypothetical protein